MLSCGLWTFTRLLIIALPVFASGQEDGNFRYAERFHSKVCFDSSQTWKTGCIGLDEATYSTYCPDRTDEAKLVTGHFISGAPSSLAGKAEGCYAYCLRTYPPNNPEKLDKLHTNPFINDITIFTCTEALNASMCVSACFHNLIDTLNFRDHAILPEGKCPDLCAKDIQRGVCDRAFALRNDSALDDGIRWCNQYCRNNTDMCQAMCSETSNFIEDNEQDREKLPAVQEIVPFIKRPSGLEDLDLWKEGVLIATSQLQTGFRSSNAYGILWHVDNNGSNFFLPHHMYLFFLPDEVLFYRRSTTLISFPLNQCVNLRIKQQLVGLDSLQNDYTIEDAFCVPGVAIPDPPGEVNIIETVFTDYVNLQEMVIHISQPSPEKHLCDNYLVTLDFYNEGTLTHKNFSTELEAFSFKGADLYKDGVSILDKAFDIKVSCVNWSEDLSSGIDPYNPPLYSLRVCDAKFRTVLFCQQNIEIKGLPHLEGTEDRNTGLWRFTVKIFINGKSTKPVKFLYVSEGQNLTYKVFDNGRLVLDGGFIPLEVGKLTYDIELPVTFEKGALVKFEGTYGSEPEAFLSDTDFDPCDRTCCISLSDPVFENTLETLTGIQPSEVKNFTILGFTVDPNAQSEDDNVKGTIQFSFSWIEPDLVAGGIAVYRIGYGVPQIPYLGTFQVNMSSANTTTNNNGSVIEATVTTGLRVDVWHFTITAVSVYDETSDVMVMELIEVPASATQSPATGNQNVPTYVYAILAVVLVVMLLVVVALTVLVVCICRRNSKVVIASSHWTRSGEVGEDGVYEPVISFEPDSWELAPNLITMENLLGEGGFGQVYMGIVRGPIRTPGYETNTSLTVAVKLLTKDATSSQKDEFLKEIDLMKRVSLSKCPHIVNTIGCCTVQEPIALVMEYVPYGNLLGYLRTSRKLRSLSGRVPEEEAAKIGNEYITVQFPGEDLNDWKTLHSAADQNPYSHLGDLEPANLIKFALQISFGMEYLSSIGVIHRDLACRNILVGEQKMLKICDFGLARENDLYIKHTAGKLPLRWMAMESITERVFTSKSDVWSFGVALWEIATLGNRLEKPNNCSMDVYQVMLQCWTANPDDRPSFTELRLLFEGMVNREKNYIDINDEFLPYYPMSAICDTTDGSLDDTLRQNGGGGGGMVSPLPMDYEIPVTYKKDSSSKVLSSTKPTADSELLENSP